MISPTPPASTQTSSLVDLQGQLERVTYTNDENGYTIGKVKVYGRRDLVTVVGAILNPTPGEILKMRGEWTNHPKFGEQFKVVFYKCAVPASVKGIEKYLGSGLIKGIGPVMAKRIVGAFGEKTLEVVEPESVRLIEVPGIGKARVGMIANAWQEQKEIRTVMVFLQRHGVSTGPDVPARCMPAKYYKQYGNEAIEVVQKNPYRLAHDIFGIGFLTADRIAEKMGFDRQSPERAQAGIIYTLHQCSDEGHVFMSRENLLTKAREILEVDDGILTAALAALGAERHIIIETLLDATEIEAVYLAKFQLSEVQAAKRLLALQAAPRSIRAINVDKAIDWVQDKLSITLAPMQTEAVRSAATHKVSVITGGPGTGKTTIIRAILRIFSPITDKILLAAPTGRAAKRMSETTGREAKTIHRLLEYNMARGGFQKNDEAPLDADIVILDEASMIDLILMHHLLKAIPMCATLILVGDVDQLPSVGAGSVLKDIIRSEAVPVVMLNEIFRQAQSSSIIVNAHKLIRGEMPTLTSRADDDFYFFPADEPGMALTRILELVKDRIPCRFGFRSVEDVQVLAPMNRGTVGTGRLNEALQETLNPNGIEVVRGGRKIRVGDKVMQIRNNYDKDVYNGDIGLVTDINTEDQAVHVDIDGNDIVYDYAELDELVLAYAVSIHKSQGSEYPVAVIPVMTQHYVMLQRNLIYTGITRGKKLVVLVGTKKALGMAVRNNRIMQRNSWLWGRLGGLS